jgi:hypothetical protein
MNLEKNIHFQIYLFEIFFMGRFTVSLRFSRIPADRGWVKGWGASPHGRLGWL